MAAPVYSTLFKRNSVFVAAIFAGAFSFSIGFDVLTSAYWDMHNRGKQWKDIRGRYIDKE
ncbi:cytochrome b-c1 complex subunit 9 [Dioszegia hungarica]|uniref:Complex III subunit 9 n=1 Tax=Dioszegia hungarica TaxID=4972 RepID=A0AA38H1W1_9TREE|nr:cytochrome b-c1 complex subunit 9 [Dioszegia hungarica]KAI9632545.1 cytochrome b-c1 complex subunit 9 [Dioszegia hungarica]